VITDLELMAPQILEVAVAVVTKVLMTTKQVLVDQVLLSFATQYNERAI
jgi:hypothetical protein